MNLPKIETPKYELTIPSTGKKVTYRPFLVKEEKILLIAQESEDESSLIRAMKEIISSCTFDEVNAGGITSFDLEYIFVKIRAKSVGEESEIGLPCSACGEINQVTVNLDDIKIPEVKPLPKKIQLTDTVGIIPRYVSVDSLIEISKATNEGETVVKTIAASIESIYDENNVYPMEEASASDTAEFVESLNKSHIEKIEKIVSSAPLVQQTVHFTCTKCGEKNTTVLEGLQNFF